MEKDCDAMLPMERIVGVQRQEILFSLRLSEKPWLTRPRQKFRAIHVRVEC